MKFFLIFLFVLPIYANKEALQSFHNAVLLQPKIKALKANILAKELDIQNALLLPEPMIELEVMKGDLKPTISLNQSFPIRQELRIKKDLKSLESELLNLQINLTIRELLTNSLSAWLDLSINDFLEELTKSDLELLDFAKNSLRAHFKHHNIGLAAILRIESQSEELKVRLANLEYENDIAKASLKTVFKNDIPEFKFPKSLKITEVKGSLANNPLLKLAKMELQLAKKGIDLAKVLKNPEFSLGLEYEPKRLMSENYSLMLGYQLKLGRGRYFRENQKANYQFDAKTEDYNSLILDLEKTETTLKANYKIAKNQINNIENLMIPNLKKAYDTKRAEYQSSATKESEEMIQVLQELLNIRLKKVLLYKEAYLALIYLSDLYDLEPSFLFE